MPRYRRRSSDNTEVNVEVKKPKRTNFVQKTKNAETKIVPTKVPVVVEAVEEKGDAPHLFTEQLKGIASDTLLRAMTLAFPHFKDRMTMIQYLTVPAVLRDAHNMTHDVMSRASTGSGKTIAFLLPCMDYLIRRFATTTTKRTLGAMVLCPTRELTLQTAEVAKKLLDALMIVDPKLKLRVVVTIGGSNKKQEAAELNKGCDLLIATPGRLLDHLREKSLTVAQNDKSFRYLVLDEADQLLDIGFEHDLRNIISFLPNLRTTMLFSATLTSKVQSLAHVSLRTENMINVGVEDDEDNQRLTRNVSTLEQKYVVVPADKRIASVIGILKANKDKKVILFVATKASVNYLRMILKELDMQQLDIVTLHGNMNQKKRSNVFFDFMKRQEPGVLIATDVAARGLDIPDVDLVIQCDLPEDWSQYSHRAGRTARAGRKGVALLVLTATERDNCLDSLRKTLKEHENDDVEHITELALPVTPQEIQSHQDCIVSVVKYKQEIQKYACGIPSQYKKYTLMHARRIGLPKGSFEENAVRSSFGLSFNRGGGKRGGGGGGEGRDGGGGGRGDNANRKKVKGPRTWRGKDAVKRKKELDNAATRE